MSRIIKRIALIAGIVLLALAVLSVTFYQVDKARVEADKTPIFTFINLAYCDGGTEFHYGLGNQIVRWNRIAEQDEVRGYLVGKEYHYLVGFRKMSDGPPRMWSILKRMSILLSSNHVIRWQ